ncbi:hypothetical protein, partial [Bradyrhizobium sp. Leo170]|uniref:hypothetical protein n=1 Tax=Bradyrhizobium sp. Leo170 TaxID=1571199 RepID=UPI001A90E2B9
LERDDFSSNRHPTLALCLSMIFFGKPVSTFPDHALVASSGGGLARRCGLAVWVVIGAVPAVRRRRQLDRRVALLLGVEHGYMKLRMSLLDLDRGLLGGLVAFVLGLQLPIDGDMKRLRERWLD